MNLRTAILVGVIAASVVMAPIATAPIAMAEDKTLPNQAGNSKVGLAGTAFTDRKEITNLLGVDLGDGYVVVKIRVMPQTPEGLRVSYDDFTLVSRKDGEKSGALSPSQMFGGTALVVGKAKSGSDSIGTRPSTPSIGGLGMPGGGGGIGNGGSTESGLAEARIVKGKDGDDPRIEPLEAKLLVTQETKQPVEGLLYFALERKVKPKDIGLIYAGPGGRLVVDFK